MGDGTNTPIISWKTLLKPPGRCNWLWFPPELQQQAVSHSGQDGDMWRLDIEHSLKMFGWPTITLVICWSAAKRSHGNADRPVESPRWLSVTHTIHEGATADEIESSNFHEKRASLFSSFQIIHWNKADSSCWDIDIKCLFLITVTYLWVVILVSSCRNVSRKMKKTVENVSIHGPETWHWNNKQLYLCIQIFCTLGIF